MSVYGPLIGRRAELEALHAAFGSSQRAITLHGPPGVGKTRLALAYVERCGSAGAYIVELGPQRDALDCCGAILLAMKLIPSGDLEAMSALIGRVLQREAALLVLDNAEHVREAISPLIASWIQDRPSARLLITSRAPLEYAGERLVPLAPLPLPEGEEAPHESACGALFMEHTPERWREPLRRDPAQRAHLLAILRALDGLPLALQLAAPRLELLTPAQLSERLRDRFKVLRDPLQPDGTRHSTLWHALDWSWRQLRPWEQAALQQLAHFPAGLSLEGAERCLVLSGAEPLDALYALLKHGLLRHDHERARFSMLQSVRDFALATIEDEASREASMLRALDHFDGRRDVWDLDKRCDDLPTFWAQVEAEEHNLRALFLWAQERWRAQPSAEHAVRLLHLARPLGPLLLARREQPRECFVLYEAVIEAVERALPEETTSVAFARCLAMRGCCHMLCMRDDAALEDLRRAHQLARHLGERTLEAICVGNLSEAAYYRQEHALAVALAEESLQRHTGHSAPWRIATAQAHLGMLLMDEDRPRACALLAQTRATFAAVGDPVWLTRVTTNLGSLALEQGDERAAAPLLEDAHALSVSTGNLRQQGITSGLLGVLEHQQARLRVARAHYQRAITLLDLISSPLRHTYRGYLGLLELAASTPDAAREALDAALRDEHDPSYLATWQLGRGIAALICHDQAAAAEAASASRRTLAQAPTSHEEALRPAAEALEAGAREELDRCAAHAAALRGARLDMARLLGAALTAWLDTIHAAAQWSIAHDGAWFQPPQGERVSLGRRKTLIRVLGGLLDKRLKAPGEPLDVQELASLGWPGEVVSKDTRQNRVYVAISTLRALGLHELIVSGESGYMLAPDRAVLRG